MTEEHRIEKKDNTKQIERIRELADRDEWPEASEVLALTRRHLTHPGISSADVQWLSAIAAEKTEQLEQAVAWATSARGMDPFDPNYVRSERVVFERVRCYRHRAPRPGCV